VKSRKKLFLCIAKILIYININGYAERVLKRKKGRKKIGGLKN
jgi:hypothetical protein